MNRSLRFLTLFLTSALVLAACSNGSSSLPRARAHPPRPRRPRAVPRPARARPPARAPLAASSSPPCGAAASRSRSRRSWTPSTPRATARRPTSPIRTDYATVLQTRITGGNPPDVSILPGIGFLRRFARDGSIKKIADLGIDPAALEANYAPGILDIGKVDDALYAIMVKFNSKSTLWYRPDKFNDGRRDAARRRGTSSRRPSRPSPTRAPSRSAWAPGPTRGR